VYGKYRYDDHSMSWRRNVIVFFSFSKFFVVSEQHFKNPQTMGVREVVGRHLLGQLFLSPGYR
jgi:hypothetical protein